ncbi:hypothetical protein HYH02_011928 [Chlamydomonas schloesseri]|uniref:Uncharacterized protein n=1 Tax=Chlamydomonas schloesseri TaxID=2026947 RepID=A0A835SYE4_9CHLO|nr:hypothetical protein HYH02_011928 [Chlamydomonas schloesseri]|eukprot:KAG2435428.1 hypothetical protein HYH02_011928 [Chlamydomonas schloesseri]
MESPSARPDSFVLRRCGSSLHVPSAAVWQLFTREQVQAALAGRGSLTLLLAPQGSSGPLTRDSVAYLRCYASNNGNSIATQIAQTSLASQLLSLPDGGRVRCLAPDQPGGALVLFLEDSLAAFSSGSGAAGGGAAAGGSGCVPQHGSAAAGVGGGIGRGEGAAAALAQVASTGAALTLSEAAARQLFPGALRVAAAVTAAAAAAAAAAAGPAGADDGEVALPPAAACETCAPVAVFALNSGQGAAPRRTFQLELRPLRLRRGDEARCELGAAGKLVKYLGAGPGDAVRLVVVASAAVEAGSAPPPSLGAGAHGAAAFAAAPPGTSRQGAAAGSERRMDAGGSGGGGGGDVSICSSRCQVQAVLVSPAARPGRGHQLRRRWQPTQTQNHPKQPQARPQLAMQQHTSSGATVPATSAPSAAWPGVAMAGGGSALGPGLHMLRPPAAVQVPCAAPTTSAAIADTATTSGVCAAPAAAAAHAVPPAASTCAAATAVGASGCGGFGSVLQTLCRLASEQHLKRSFADMLSGGSSDGAARSQPRDGPVCSSEDGRVHAGGPGSTGGRGQQGPSGMREEGGIGAGSVSITRTRAARPPVQAQLRGNPGMRTGDVSSRSTAGTHPQRQQQENEDMAVGDKGCSAAAVTTDVARAVRVVQQRPDCYWGVTGAHIRPNN